MRPDPFDPTPDLPGTGPHTPFLPHEHLPSGSLAPPGSPRRHPSAHPHRSGVPTGPGPSRGGSNGGPSRGTVMECDACGYVFVLASLQVSCRRCHANEVRKWGGGRQ